MRRCLLGLCAVLVGSFGGLSSAQCDLQPTGFEVPRLQSVEDAFRQYMCDRGIEGGVLGVMHDGVVVYERGFGRRNAAGDPMPVDAMMRLASVSKPLTAAAVRELIDDGRFSLSTKVFRVGGNGGLLDLEPFGGAFGDPRLADITVDHLLHHRGGWDRDIAGDLTYREVLIASDMGVASPPGREATVRWILSRPLEHAPGAEYAYSNIGYLVLGMIVEQESGQGLIEFIEERVLGPLGNFEDDFELGRTFAADQNPREPTYFFSGTSQNVFDPDGPAVNRPYGGWDHEARIGQGGQIASVRPLLAFLQNRYVSGPDIGRPRSFNEGPTWRRNFTGSLPGTNTLARQRADGTHYVVLFNERQVSGTSFAASARSVIDGVLDTTDINWPDHEPRAFADFAEPFGALDFFDVIGMGRAVDAGDAAAD